MTRISPDPILVTGCSSGIGEAVARYLLLAGHTVYASARRPETLEPLRLAGAHVLALDVTDEASMSAAVDTVVATHGRVGTLINNAGFGEYGTIEEVDLADVRKMFDTNVFGLARLCQLVLPSMREAGGGRIVNIGSMGGRMTFPVGGYYHASKYAVEAISDALRNEVAGFGIDVVLVEPGAMTTRFEDTINSSAALSPDRLATSPYRSFVERALEKQRVAFSNRLMAGSPQSVARVVLSAVESDRPRARYLVSAPARALVHARRLGGDRVWDAIVRSQYGTTAPAQHGQANAAQEPATRHSPVDASPTGGER